MNVDFKGYGENVATFLAADGLQAGDLVKMSGNFTVAAATEDSDFVGVCLGVRDGYAAVQTSGYTEVVFTGELSTGYQILACEDSETVAAAEDGRVHLVVSAANGIAGIMI